MAQLEVKPGSFKIVEGFVNINPDPDYQTDDNDLPLSVIKVKTENITDKQRRELSFESNLATYIVIEYKIGEVWVYLTSKYADYLKISHPDLSSTEFTLPMDLMPKKGYELTLVNKTSNQMLLTFGSLSISTPYVEGASIKINDTPIVDKTPCNITTFPVGTYTITVYKDSYYAVSKTVEVLQEQKTEVEFNMKHVRNNANNNVNWDEVDNEGMWLPMFIDRLNYADMKKTGLQLTSDELYSVNHSSLKDAIVGLSTGAKPQGFRCTGEIVSDKGLVMTTYSSNVNIISALSTVEHNWLEEGFWAKNYEEELPVKDVSASFLVRVEDVTSKVLSAVNKNMDYLAKNKAINEKKKELVEAASNGSKLNPVIKSFYDGNEYYMFVYKTYTDVRLVGAPPQSIGRFGGDTDNCMWPRTTAGFCIFRVYADQNGEPADYSPNNKPLSSKKHIPISLDGVQENDFTLSFGFPGHTQRYSTSYYIKYLIDTTNPLHYGFYKAKTDVMDKYINTNESVYLKYASTRASDANALKNLAGRMIMIRKNKVIENKVQLENQFTEWTNAKNNRHKEYGYILDSLRVQYEKLGFYADINYYPSSLIDVGILKTAGIFVKYKNNPTNKSLLNNINVDELFKNLDTRVEKEIFVSVVKLYGKHCDVNDVPAELQKLLQQHNGDWETLANSVYDNSIFSNPKLIKSFIKNPDVNKLSKDPAFIMYNALREQSNTVYSLFRNTWIKINEYNDIYVKGLREFYADTQPDKVLYPDGNGTMRLTYGPVKGYVSQEGKTYNYYTTSQDMLNKYIPGDHDFDAPEQFVELLEKRDFGRYSDENDDLRLCFLARTDITGGSSGAACINSKGEIVGLAFDGNWEAIDSDFQFTPDVQRAIYVDIRYVLFIIDKYAGAKNIIDELDIRQ